jgi:hypothetical protein
MSTPHTLDAAAIQALVAEVVRRIQAGQAAAPRSAAPPVPAAATATPAAAAGAAITERVITLAMIERVPAGVQAVSAVATAVITPSAADRARERGITIVRGGPATPAVASRPFVIAQAACRSDASARTSAIARAIPGAQQLPTSGLADVVAALAGHASRDAALGVLLTSRPAVALVLANRSASLRAVTGRDAAAIASAAADAAANLLIIDPAAFSGGALDRLCIDFHRRPSAPVPTELQAAPAGCGCKTHTH